MATNIAKIQIRHDTTANWTLYNPILALGEWALEILTDGKTKIKIGDGNTAWASLVYFESGGGGSAPGGTGSGFVNLSYPSSGAALTGFTSLLAAVASVPAANRVLAEGVLFYNNTTSSWQIYIYRANTTTDDNWLNISNWENLNSWTITELITLSSITYESANKVKFSNKKYNTSTKLETTTDVILEGTEGNTVVWDTTNLDGKPRLQIEGITATVPTLMSNSGITILPSSGANPTIVKFSNTKYDSDTIAPNPATVTTDTYLTGVDGVEIIEGTYGANSDKLIKIQGQGVSRNYKGIYYVDATTTEAAAKRDGSLNHPWQSWDEIKNLSTPLDEGNILIRIHGASLALNFFVKPGWTVESYGEGIFVAGTQITVALLGTSSSLLPTTFKNFLFGSSIADIKTGNYSVVFEDCSFQGNLTLWDYVNLRASFVNCSFLNLTVKETRTLSATTPPTEILIKNSTFQGVLSYTSTESLASGRLLIEDCKNVPLKVELSSSYSEVVVKGSTNLIKHTSLTPADTYGAVITGGVVSFETNNTENTIPIPIRIIGNTKYSLGRFAYDAVNSIIDTTAVEFLIPLQARQIQDLHTPWEVLNPSSPRQSDINKAIDASLSTLNRQSAPRGEVLSAYEPEVAYVITGATIMSGNVYSIDTATVNQPGSSYKNGDTVTVGGDTVLEVETTTTGAIAGVSKQKNGVGYPDFSGVNLPILGGSGSGLTIDLVTASGYKLSTLMTYSISASVPDGAYTVVMEGDVAPGSALVTVAGNTINSVALADPVIYSTNPTSITFRVNGVEATAGGLTWSSVFYSDLIFINAPGTGYVVGDVLTYSFGGSDYNLQMTVDSLVNTISGVEVINPGLSLADFSGTSVTTTALTGTGTGLTLNIATLTAILPTASGYKIGDVVIIRVNPALTLSQAHLVVTGVDGSGIPTGFSISNKGAYTKNISGIHSVGTSGQGTSMALSVTSASEVGDTLRKYLLAPDGTATAANQAHPGDMVKVLHDENFGGSTRNYIFADYNGDGKYNFVPQSGVIPNSPYMGDEVYTHVDEENRLILLTDIAKSKIENAVQKVGDETISGVKSFTSSPVVPSKDSAPSPTGTTVLATEAQVAKAIGDIDGGDWDL